MHRNDEENGMNFDDAIRIHTQWKMKLSNYIAKPDRSLDSALVATDNQCELGKWLHGDGRKYAAIPEFTALITEHQRFHRAASEVVKKADSGLSMNQEVALGSKSEFATVSAGLVKILMNVKAKNLK